MQDPCFIDTSGFGAPTNAATINTPPVLPRPIRDRLYFYRLTEM